MMSLMLASIFIASETVAAQPAVAAKQETLICRPIIAGVARSSDVTICKTKAQWWRHDACRGVTRYCERKKTGQQLGHQTAFALTDDAQIVCRIVKPTGSRLANQKVCLPKREWQRMWEQGNESARSLQQQSIKIRGEQ
jgi:hypothetical protein